jgi:hypothetical protein
MALVINVNGFSGGLRSGHTVQRISRDVGMISGNITFDSSYASGGESLAGSGVLDSNSKYTGLDNFFRPNGTTSGILQLDISLPYGYKAVITGAAGSEKVKLYRPAPVIVYDEVVTCTAAVGYLRWPAAHIISVSSSTATHHKVIPGGLTPASGQVAVAQGIDVTTGVFTRGTRTSLTFETDPTTAYVTYITQAWKEVTDNMKQLKMTAGARIYGGNALAVFTPGTPDSIELGEVAAAVQAVLHNDNGTYVAGDGCYKGVDPATGEVAWDPTDSANVTANTTSLNVKEEDTWDTALDSLYVNYIALPSSGFLYDRWTEEMDLTPSSDIITPTRRPLLWGMCGCLPGPTTKYADLLHTGATVGTTATNAIMSAGVPLTGAVTTFTAGSDHADSDHFKISGIFGDQSEIAREDIEVPNGADVSHLSAVSFRAIGYIR